MELAVREIQQSKEKLISPVTLTRRETYKSKGLGLRV
jgi:hypothetical protein